MTAYKLLSLANRVWQKCVNMFHQVLPYMCMTTVHCNYVE